MAKNTGNISSPAKDSACPVPSPFKLMVDPTPFAGAKAPTEDGLGSVKKVDIGSGAAGESWMNKKFPGSEK